MTTPAAHPARYNPRLLDLFAIILHKEVHVKPPGRLLDPMAGTGERLADLQTATGWLAQGIELEPVFIVRKDIVDQGDACNLMFPTGWFHAIVVSPTYGNGMNDHFLSSEGSARHTYVHRARAIRNEPSYLLPLNNTGRWHFDTPEYRILHEQAWRESVRVLAPGGVFILNTKNAVSRQRRETCYCVTAWHVGLLIELGLVVESVHAVGLGGLTHGDNRERVGWEDVTVLRKVR